MAGGTKKRILIIDDDDLVLQIICEVVESFGYDVTSAPDGESGLEMLAKGPLPDIVVTDIIMPGLSGLEVIADVKRKFPGVRIVAMSGGGGSKAGDNLATAQELGADATLAKPVDFPGLLDILKDLSR